MPGHGNARQSEGVQSAESTAVMEALAAMGDRLNQSLDAFNKHLTSMDSSIQHSEAEMGERLSAMAHRIEQLEVKNASSGPYISHFLPDNVRTQLRHVTAQLVWAVLHLPKQLRRKTIVKG